MLPGSRALDCVRPEAQGPFHDSLLSIPSGNTEKSSILHPPAPLSSSMSGPKTSTTAISSSCSTARIPGVTCLPSTIMVPAASPSPMFIPKCASGSIQILLHRKSPPAPLDHAMSHGSRRAPPLPSAIANAAAPAADRPHSPGSYNRRTVSSTDSANGPPAVTANHHTHTSHPAATTPHARLTRPCKRNRCGTCANTSPHINPPTKPPR
jgi:hypothetical protein